MYLIMEDYPKTTLEFEKRSATEEACREYFLTLRWPNGFQCPNCGNQKAWLTDRNLYHCGNCGMQTSLFAGTIFQDTKKPLRLWFNAIWHITNQKYGANALGSQRILGLGSYRTAWAWLHKLRVAMLRPPFKPTFSCPPSVMRFCYSLYQPVFRLNCAIVCEWVPCF